MDVLDNYTDTLEKPKPTTPVNEEVKNFNAIPSEKKKVEKAKNVNEGNDKAYNVKKISKLICPHFFMSVLFLIAYFSMLGSIIYIEASDKVNMQKGENSMMKELQILMGAITAGFVQILNYWFSNNGKSDKN